MESGRAVWCPRPGTTVPWHGSFTQLAWHINKGGFTINDRPAAP
jgi:hypothetical protein